MSNQTVLTKPAEALAARVAAMPESLQLAALSYHPDSAGPVQHRRNG